jgi:Domain of unknown function (DUF4396)
MLNGVMLLWFLMTAASVLFVAIDIRSTPESPVLKWGFVLLTLYTGPIGAFLYVLGCREPLSGLHEQYIAARWRQTLGSTMHCVAGDGVGILAGAAIGSVASLPHLAEIALEYALGFAFGWTIFQALFMRDIFGGSYRRSLLGTFNPEFLSMNWLMSGMVVVAALGRALIGRPISPLTPEFWFVMSMALLAGFIVAYPINWRLVATGLKHGMMTVRPPVASGVGHGPATAHSHGRSANATSLAGMSHDPHVAHGAHQSAANLAGMTILSIFALGAGVGLALAIARMS